MKDQKLESQVLPRPSNRTAWLAAFGAPISGFVVAFTMAGSWGNPLTWSSKQVLLSWVARVFVMWLLLWFDYFWLKRSGLTPESLGIPNPADANVYRLPPYLFARAGAFGHSKAYAITWCVLVITNVLISFL